jgi:hypothetical protein
MRAAADGRHWGPLLFLPLVFGATWLLRELTGTHLAPAPRPDLTPEQQWTLHVIGWVIVPLVIVFLPWAIGRLAGGRASLLEVFFVVLWSNVPLLVATLPLEVASVAAYGAEDPRLAASTANYATVLALPPVALALYLLERVLELWTLGLMVVGLSEVQRFSAVRALVTLILPLFLLGFVAALAATLLVVSLSASGG